MGWLTWFQYEVWKKGDRLRESLMEWGERQT